MGWSNVPSHPHPWLNFVLLLLRCDFSFLRAMLPDFNGPLLGTICHATNPPTLSFPGYNARAISATTCFALSIGAAVWVDYELDTTNKLVV